jgi:hypothetical protein
MGLGKSQFLVQPHSTQQQSQGDMLDAGDFTVSREEMTVPIINLTNWTSEPLVCPPAVP